MQNSRITSKHQATAPADFLTALNVGAGDTLDSDVRGGVVQVRKARALEVAFAAAEETTLHEWASAEDDEAWRGL